MVMPRQKRVRGSVVGGGGAVRPGGLAERTRRYGPDWRRRIGRCASRSIGLRGHCAVGYAASGIAGGSPLRSTSAVDRACCRARRGVRCTGGIGLGHGRHAPKRGSAEKARDQCTLSPCSHRCSLCVRWFGGFALFATQIRPRSHTHRCWHDKRRGARFCANRPRSRRGGEEVRNIEEMSVRTFRSFSLVHRPCTQQFRDRNVRRRGDVSS